MGTRWNRLGEAVLTSTHNLCFGLEIRKIGLPPQTPFFLLYEWGIREYTFPDGPCKIGVRVYSIPGFSSPLNYKRRSHVNVSEQIVGKDKL